MLSKKYFLEVKRGRTSPLEFNWFHQQFPHQVLTVINKDTFASDQIQGITLEDFLLEKDVLGRVPKA